MAISNLRDLLIWLLAILIIRNYNKREINWYVFAVFCSIALYMLRPFMLATVWLAVIFFEIGPFIKNLITKINVKRIASFLVFVLALGIVVFFASPTIGKKIRSYQYNATYLVTKGYEERAKQRRADGVIDASNMPKAIFMSHVRYVLTPMPHAIVERMFSSELSTEYGITSEALRLYTQLVYYFILIWLLFNLRTVYRSLRILVFEQKAFLLWLLAFLPIYSIAHFGGSHQRLKLPFQLLLLILFIYSRHFKKMREI
ncbi:hypothetical protein [Flagellimonas allohymeniacidonis]|uniref:O-antigen ligase domain-containing protein n=1 Tax=Flagellimonas allohymeniacidonis TaxID=2517819 RepID=A0A4Q8QB85_9FLAO|nr:hypothetical protein [Allomuricauda hymeniacidonis]TAI47541.1 hypothetical protein EW142_12800 [Allomuricauda hymeniacidonis]